MSREENIQRFKDLMGKIEREGKDELMTYLETKTDFYYAPASTRFHLSCEGGLLQHSLNVYDCLMAKKESPIWKNVLAKIPEESLIIMALLHDLCKVNTYVKGSKNQKTYDSQKVAAADKWQVKHDNNGDFIWETIPTYEMNDSVPLGHGEKSVMLANFHMKLRTAELFAIRWHMGFTEEKNMYKMLGEAMDKYPIILALHEADLEASKLLESMDGNKE